MEIELLKIGNETIRKVQTTSVQIDLHNNNLYITGKDIVKMANGEEFTGQPAQLCNPEPVAHQMPGQQTEEESAKQARNTAKEDAKSTCINAIKTAVEAYVKACYLIDNPQPEGGE